MIKLALTYGRNYEAYHAWFARDKTIELITLGLDKGPKDKLVECQGLVLTGGEDIHPWLYNKSEYLEAFNLKDINQPRDEFEMELIFLASELALPVMGICRGMQLFNVYHGGTLIPDLVRAGNDDHTKLDDLTDREHPISLTKGSHLLTLNQITKTSVNSAHHQGIDKLAEPFRKAAVSKDKVYEAFEWKEPNNNPYIMMVQWHPERMEDPIHPMSFGIKNDFINAVRHANN